MPKKRYRLSDDSARPVLQCALDGVSFRRNIPQIAGNRHYDEYIMWLDRGNTVEVFTIPPMAITDARVDLNLPAEATYDELSVTDKDRLLKLVLRHLRLFDDATILIR